MKNYIILLFITLLGCSDFLDEMPKGKIIPKTVDDLGGMMDDFWGGGSNNISGGTNYANFLDDDGHVYSQDAPGLVKSLKNIYSWQKSTFAPSEDDKLWNDHYHSIYISNWVLENIDKVEESKSGNYKRETVKAWALVNRAFNYFTLVNNYAPFYNSNKAATDLAIPLVKEADINLKLGKSTVKEVYDLILADLSSAINQLNDTEEYVFRPSKQNTYALLARIYMFRQEYDNMLTSAKEALKLKSDLLDYNTLIPGFFVDMGLEGWAPLGYTYKVPGILLFRSSDQYMFTLSNPLLNLFDKDKDLRYKYFTSNLNTSTFMPDNEYRISFLYNSTNSLTMGELYIMAAEAYLRANNGKDLTKARFYLNQLRKNRMENPIEITETNEVLLLKEVMDERRRETRMKGLRWFDLKRLNIKDKISHKLLDKEFVYDPTQGEYFLPIPTNVIQANPKLQ